MDDAIKKYLYDIHGYDNIDNEIIWGTILRHLPILKKEINDLLID